MEALSILEWSPTLLLYVEKGKNLVPLIIRVIKGSRGTFFFFFSLGVIRTFFKLDLIDGFDFFLRRNTQKKKGHYSSMTSQKFQKPILSEVQLRRLIIYRVLVFYYG